MAVAWVAEWCVALAHTEQVEGVTSERVAAAAPGAAVDEDELPAVLEAWVRQEAACRSIIGCSG